MPQMADNAISATIANSADLPNNVKMDRLIANTEP